MNAETHSVVPTRLAAWAAAVVLAGLSLPSLAATRDFSAQKPADPAGTVEIINVEGAIEVSGWDQAMVDVSGTIGDKVERVEVTSSANRTTVRVVVPSGGGNWSGGNDAHLKIRVPRNSALDVSLVSADLRISGVSGNQQLRTVSGNILGDAGGELQVNTVSGDVSLTAHDGHHAQFKTVSGDVKVSGTDGDFTLNTVSGDAMVTLGDLTRAQLETVSGDISVVAGTLAAQGQLDATSVSGDLQVRFAVPPDADIEVQTFSGDINNCFGPKPAEEKYAPGSRLNFRSGKGGGRVHIDSKSGDVGLCAGK